MGLWMFLFDRAQWNYWYGNCSYKSPEEWSADGSPEVPIGIVYITIGVICEVCLEIFNTKTRKFQISYIPFLIVMSRREFIQHSCYKLMFLLGIIDMIVLPFNSIIGGISCARGTHFCTSPKFNFIVGVIGTCKRFFS